MAEHTSPKHHTVKHMTLLAMLLAMALAIYYIESQLSLLLPIPGMKPGLANVITMIVLLHFGKRDALTVLLLRILLTTVFNGSWVYGLYSIAGGLFSFLVMVLVYEFISRRRSVVLASTLGGISHNMGQLIVAAYFLGGIMVKYYTPYLILLGAVTGLFTGLAARYTYKIVKQIKQE